MFIRKFLICSVALALAIAAVPSFAAAAPAVPGGDTTTYDFPAGEYCAFPIEITLVSNETYRDDTAPGPVFFTGAAEGTVTNEATGATRTYNLSGPGFAGGTTVTGPQLIGQPASRNVGSPFLIVAYGRVTFTPDFTIASRTGSVTDVCAALS
jgi:hypothetical protein